MLVAAFVLVLGGGLAAGAPLKGDGPTTIAAGYGAVWVGTGNGTLVRLDALSGRATHRLLREPGLQYGFVHSLATGFGSVWVAQGRYDTLKRIDARTNRSVDIRPRGRWTATLVATGRGAVWAGDFERNAVFRIEPRTNRVVARIRVPGTLWGLAAGPAGVWVVTHPGARITDQTPREVRRLDTRTNQVGAVVLRSPCDFALAVGTSSLWVSDLCTKRLTRMRDRMSVRVEEASISVAAGEGSVWVLSQTRGTVSRLDARTGRVVATIRVRGTWLTVGAGSVWVLDLGDGLVGFVRRIDPRTNRVVGPPIRVVP